MIYTCDICIKNDYKKSNYDKLCKKNNEEVVYNKKLNSNIDNTHNMKMSNSLGQYFTTNHELKNMVLKYVMNSPDIILEPSVGQGDLIQIIYNNNNNIKFDMYEIDRCIHMYKDIPNNVIYKDFLKEDINKAYKTIIGNPPYIRTKKGNLYIDFIEKCYNLLENNGELIFIIPSDFFKLTSASNLLNNMLSEGTFTHIHHPHNEKMFENAHIDIIVFRYCKNNTLPKQVLYNNEPLYIINNEGLITFNKNNNTNDISFKEYFSIYVGLVSGKDNVYKNKEYGNIEILNGENKADKYIFIDKYPSNNKNIDTYMLSHKDELMSRKIKKFNENNWFEWGAPRNINNIKEHIGKECIYIYNLTRKKNIAFKGRVNYFGGGLIILIPKKNINIDNIISYMNNDTFKKNFMFSGRFKIGHRQISNSYIPDTYL